MTTTCYQCAFCEAVVAITRHEDSDLFRPQTCHDCKNGPIMGHPAMIEVPCKEVFGKEG